MNGVNLRTYKDPEAQRVYDAMTTQYYRSDTQLFHPDGAKRWGSPNAVAFWRGWSDVFTVNPYALRADYRRGSPEGVSYGAGKDCARGIRNHPLNR